MRLMAQIIQADEGGALTVPPGAAGPVQPGQRFIVEPCGDAVILRREPTDADHWRETMTPEEWVASLQAWVASLPPNPPVPVEASGRDSMYD
jgi:hypothetical protein